METASKQERTEEFLGFCCYFKEHIRAYSAVAFELTELLAKAKPNKLEWNEKAEQSFIQLKHALTSKPVLRAPDFTKPFLLYTDASQKSLGCILMQPGDDDKAACHVTAYASKKLLPRERRHSTVELELAAICFGLNKFHEYLYNNEVKIFSDHRPLQWLSSLSKHSPRLARLNLIIQDYNVTTTYVKGQCQIADALTRMP